MPSNHTPVVSLLSWSGAVLAAVAGWRAVVLCADQPSRFDLSDFPSTVGRSTLPLSASSDSAPRPPLPSIECHPAQPFPFAAVRPVRLITLINGDSLTGELLRNAADTFELRLLAGSRVRIPRAMVDSITMPPGERELIDIDPAVESPPPRFPWVLRLPATDADFRLTFRFRNATSESARSPGFGCAWHFADGSQLRIEPNALGHWQTVERSDSISVESRHSAVIRAGWRRCRLLRVQQRLFLSIDEQLIAAGRAPQTGPVGIEFFAMADDPPRLPAVLEHVSYVEVRRDRPAEPAVASLRGTDQILGEAGEIWWGRVRKLGASGVTWTDPAVGDDAMWQRSWRDVRGVRFQPPDEPRNLPPLFGCVVRIELQSSTDRPDLPGDKFIGMLGHSASGRLFVTHPLIGPLAIPVEAIRRVEPRFLGEWRRLFPQVVHFDGAPLEQPQDDSPANSIAGRFSLRELPGGAAFVAVEADGLDPSGAATPPGSRSLSDLRTGRFTTELYLNDRRIGSFNELTSDWSLPGQFDRLRMRIPNELLRVGENTWRIAQQPGTSRHIPYDDCRLRNVSLEIGPF